MLEIKNVFYNTPNPELWRNYDSIMKYYEDTYEEYKERIAAVNAMYVAFLNGEISVELEE